MESGIIDAIKWDFTNTNIWFALTSRRFIWANLSCVLFQGGSQQGLDSVGRAVTGGSLKREPSYSEFSRYRGVGPPSDGASDTASTSSLFPPDYNGPKLFVKPSAKSNKSIILNALNVVLAGAVNADTKKRATNVSKLEVEHLISNIFFWPILRWDCFSVDLNDLIKLLNASIILTLVEGLIKDTSNAIRIDWHSSRNWNHVNKR